MKKPKFKFHQEVWYFGHPDNWNIYSATVDDYDNWTDTHMYWLRDSDHLFRRGEWEIFKSKLSAKRNLSKQ